MITVLFLLGHFLLAAALMALANGIGMIPWRRAAEAHWTERARLLWPVRVTASINLFVLPPLLLNLHQTFSPETSAGVVLECLAGFLGALLGCYPSEQGMFPGLEFRAWLHQVVVIWGIRAGYWGSLVAACVLMPEDPGWETLSVAVGYLGVHLAFVFGITLKLLRWGGVLLPAGEPLRLLVETLGAARGIRVRATWELKGPMALAFAFPFTRELLFSRALLEACPPEELSTICAHELAHLSESRTVQMGRLLGSLALFPLIFLRPLFHQFELPGLLAAAVAAALLSVFSTRLSRRMEQRADQQAATGEPEDGVYARALETLYRINLIPAVTPNDRQTHPHLYDRMLAAGVTPDYPRPQKPSSLTIPGKLFLALLVASVAWRVLGEVHAPRRRHFGILTRTPSAATVAEERLPTGTRGQRASGPQHPGDEKPAPFTGTV